MKGCRSAVHLYLRKTRMSVFVTWMFVSRGLYSGQGHQDEGLGKLLDKIKTRNINTYYADSLLM